MLTLELVRIVQDDFSLAVDFTLEQGRILALIGPSGAGKSTLLNVIAGFFPPQSGRVMWQGRDITGQVPGQRPIAMLFQDNNLFPHLSALQNVSLGLRPDLKLDQAERDQVQDALRRVGLAGLGDRKPGNLSGGQQSRVALARILVQRRPLVLLDEPFAALGPALKRDMLRLVRDVMADIGGTLIMVSHDPDDARMIADLTAVVADGTVSTPQPTKDLFETPSAALRAYLGD
ncbi:Thiamine import ATP-binding protein ThiQ [Thalassovita gelatinovora]|uniref:Thiamine import ATP-binding protein ThiQ n=1 Tax=Thalassovita gelatinovora TaxID=53501 RepID=A0A0P1FMR4_THAGE|nr:ATP-binding cassette domain-containing protein [Thalassovita gelatinovora]QIZ80961.1 ATP-binding cassette domain-containing protein [Thalassovita gelatinovora]CUH63494.1 Thiamine import ATP-binding protein ThiQ [Thalassovita gelatinovora]SEQ67982.1 thiamine transport system ATP-binding protein [Thalassovita gelatinovora]